MNVEFLRTPSPAKHQAVVFQVKLNMFYTHLVLGDAVPVNYGHELECESDEIFNKLSGFDMALIFHRNHLERI